MSGRLDDMEFGPTLPVFRLALACLLLAFLALVFTNEAAVGRTLGRARTARFVAEAAAAALFMAAAFGLLVSYLLLPFRLRFTEEGLRRWTLFGPRFVPWSAVKKAQIGSYRGYYALELWVTRRRWVCVPLLEYRRGAALLDEIRRRLPVEVAVSSRQRDLQRLAGG